MPQSTPQLGRAALTALALLLATACGSTVQVRHDAASDQGLGGQQQVDGGSGATAQPGGATTGAPGAVGTTGVSTGTSGGTTGGATSTSGGTAAGPGATGGAATGTVTTPGTAGGQHAPVQIGFITTSVGNAQALGANPGNTYTDKAMYEALVAEYNLAGGVAGHRILPVYGETDTASSNWANDFSAVCAKFTQDNKVKAVIGYIFVFLPSFENCLVKAGVAHLYGGYQPGDIVAQRGYPTLVSTAHPTVDGFALAALAGALQRGLLTTKTKLGLLMDTCANGERAYNSSIVPWLKSHGINYQTVLIDCARGASDVSAAAAAVSSAELKFSSSGVNLVYAFGVGMIVFMQQAESQGYRPQYLTAVGGAAVADTAPAAQVKNMHGFGWMPSVDVDAQHPPYPPSPAQKACLTKLAKHGLRPAAYNDYMSAYQACDGIELYAKALAATGTPAARQIADAVVAALPGFRGAGTYGGSLHATRTQRGGAMTMREYGYDGGCSCLTYRGAPLPVPTS